MAYHPSEEILDRYAKVLVNFALGGGVGIKPGQIVYVQGPTSALPFYTAIQKAIINSGGTAIGGLYDDTSGMARYFMDRANEQQLTKFLKNYSKGLVAVLQSCPTTTYTSWTGLTLKKSCSAKKAGSL
jgi:aminopeptidase